MGTQATVRISFRVRMVDGDGVGLEFRVTSGKS
jgi:hypothetical protein